MRCKNCGWPNEDNVSRCIKCNAPLQGSMVENNRQPSYSGANVENLHSTLREPSTGVENNEYTSRDAGRCMKCGYPLGAGASVCPVCQTPVQSFRQTPSQSGGNYRGGTINPWAAPKDASSFCTLKRIPWQTEKVSYEPVSYSGQSVILNRANTDSNNNSITSKEQAVLSLEDGEWFIENKSEMQTTLVRVDRKVKLQDGDVIVLGNRMFEFRKG